LRKKTFKNYGVPSEMKVEEMRTKEGSRVSFLQTSFMDTGQPIKGLAQRRNKQTFRLEFHTPFYAERQTGKL